MRIITEWKSYDDEIRRLKDTFEQQIPAETADNAPKGMNF